MSINNGHTPLPNSFIADLNSLELTHREYRLMMTIGTEIYRFPEGRKTLSKELATRYLEKLTNIRQNHISKMLNKFHCRGYIRYIKSHIKGQGSIIILTLDTAAGSDNLDTITVSETIKSDTAVASDPVKLATVTGSNQINQSKKDHQESDLIDSTTDTDKEKQKTKEATVKNPFNCNNSMQNNSCNESNSNNFSINLLRPAGPGAASNEFTSMSTILSGYIPVLSQISDMSESSAPILSPVVIEEGKKLLLSKGFNKEQIQSISRRIIESIKKHNPEKPDAYFLTSAKNEKVKTLSCSHQTITAEKHSINNSHNRVPSSTVVTKPETVKKAEIEEAPSARELLTEIQAIAPDELYEIIMSVDSDKNVQKSLAFFSSDIVREEILASHYVSAFKKKHPEKLNI